MSDSKTILIVGNSVYIGAVLARNLVKAGHKVKAPNSHIYRDDIYLAVNDLKTIGNVNLTSFDDDDFYTPEKLKEIISGCNVIVFIGQFSIGNNDKQDFDICTSMFDIAKASGIERIIYVSNGNTSLIEHLKSMASYEFTVIIVDATEFNDINLAKKLKVPMTIFDGKTAHYNMITLYDGKQKDIRSHINLPDTWYQNNSGSDFNFYIYGMADLCLLLSERSLDEIRKKTWAKIVTCKIFMNRLYFVQKFHKFLKKPYVPGVGRINRIKRLLDVSLMMIYLNFWPEKTYRYSTRKSLPNESMRYPKNSRPVLPLKLIKSRTSNIPTMKEINVVLRGASFNIERLEELSGPIFLVSFWEPINTKKDVVYVMGRARNALRIGELGYEVIHTEVNKVDRYGKMTPSETDYDSLWYKQFPNSDNCSRISMSMNISYPSWPFWTPTGSGLQAICALSYFAEKINVYGWDFYLESSPEDMSSLQLLFNMYKYKLDVLRSRNHLEVAIINFYYGYQFSKMSNFNIYGYLGQLGRHEKLAGKLERVLFNG